MKHIFSVMAVCTLALLSTSVTAGVLDPYLSSALKTADEGHFIRVYIKPDRGPDLAALQARASGLPKADRRDFVVEMLKLSAAQNHHSILRLLKEEEALGNVRDVRPLWLANVIGVHARKSSILRLVSEESVARVNLVRASNALLNGPIEESGAPPEPSPLMPDTVWNLTLIDAPCAWDAGHTGQGVVVGHFDTGVNYNHVDLSDHLWVNSAEVPDNSVDDDGNGYIDDYYGYDFSNSDPDPMDDNGHGTHTAGTVAGDGTAGRNTGVAPDAMIMSLKVLDWFGSGTEFETWEAIQYAMEMGAEVLTFSIGWLYYYTPDRATWRGSFDAVRAAGICAAVAAGNEGQHWLYPWWYAPPENLRTPGDVPPPWLHPDQTLTGGVSGVVSAGATDVSDALASFSSQGPVSWSLIAPYMDYPYNPEMGLLDPDVTAPGVEVTSLRHSSNTGYVGGPSWSGTSMATPHVAGLMALMLSKNPALTPAVVDSIIEMTALDLGSPDKDNQYGSGRIRVCDAISAVPEGVQEGRPVHTVQGSSRLIATPNPFATQLEVVLFFADGSSGPGSVRFYDLGGRLVRELRLADSQLDQPIQHLSWDGRDERGLPLTDGIYFLRVEVEREILSEKVILLR